ncbi:NAD(P)-binding domain-containing protein [Rhizobium sp. CIAT894]|uniref:NmrA family NAD(P)-binding protein n=1 Tax=Rhizobium sp. CIAT894 TaxID=2020312 RepID=UPI000A200EBA|nr:NAD(P)H-binding protein [Rhizobium sp. CIAT894]ARM88133.1 NAD(P)-binding domain-containing protein [Rhizobium sp. CIAT894]
MIAILGAAGNVGFATSTKLREAGVPVRAILRDEGKADRLRSIGCDVAIADLHDTAALATALGGADTAQIILPPPTQAEDAVGEMKAAIESLYAALETAQPKRVLIVSDYGAHIDEWIGMPSAFRLLEDRLRQLSIPKIILRSAEHMQGWAAFFPVAAGAGVLPSLHHPIDAQFPTISAPDLGVISARLLLDEGTWGIERILHAEGPRRYSAADVAAAMGELLGRQVAAMALPRDQWQESLEKVLSPSTTKLLIDLYDAHNKGGLVDVQPGGEVFNGTTDLVEALRPLAPATGGVEPA